VEHHSSNYLTSVKGIASKKGITDKRKQFC
jgi:hypothetical protein